MLLKVDNLMFNYSDKELFNNACLQLNAGEHAVLVGKNGAGKTTLFDLLVKNLSPDRGTITWTPGVTYSYLDQHYKVNDNVTVMSFMYETFISFFRKEEEMEKLYEKGSDMSDPDWERYINNAQKINDYLLMNDFYSIKEKVNTILTGLGIPTTYLSRELITLSSGQREKVYLAKMLIEERDVLLLDEPTNYLDIDHVFWLIEYLKKFPKAYLVISHDEFFLSEIANVVFSLENKVITRYKGDYKYYLEQSVIRKEQYEKDFEAQQRYIKKEEEFIEKNICRATSSRAAKSRRKRLAHLEVMEAPVNDTNFVHINFPYSGDIGKEILQVEELVIGYNNKPLLNPISFELRKNEKIAVIGKNGIGKSTLIKTLMNILPKINGSFHFNEKYIVNYFSQVEGDDLSLTPVMYLKQFFPDKKDVELRSTLGRCGVKAELALRRLSDLSGGEEAKTRLALLTMIKSNILVLDEPTNHLDVVAKESLKDAIDRFEGNVILVSHEKEFYEDIVDYIIELK